MPPEERFVCRFAAEPSAGPAALRPLGRHARTPSSWRRACGSTTRARTSARPGQMTWFPDRTWGGRTYVPASTRSSTGFELYGYVSFTPGDQPRSPRTSSHGRTSPTSPPTTTPSGGWTSPRRSIGGWRGEQGKVAAMTLVWGHPLLRGAATATAELARPDRRPVHRSPRIASRCSPPTPTAATTSRSRCATARAASWRASRSTRTTPTRTTSRSAPPATRAGAARR